MSRKGLRSLWSGRQTKRVFIVGVLFVIVSSAACAFFRISGPQDIAAYAGMAGECHPVWRQFAFRRAGAGDSAADFVRRFPPSDREEFGRYGIYQYYPGNAGDGIWFTGLTVAARDGRLIRSQAWSCTWQFAFFDCQDASLDGAYATFLRDRSERLRKDHDSER